MWGKKKAYVKIVDRGNGQFDMDMRGESGRLAALLTLGLVSVIHENRKDGVKNEKLADDACRAILMSLNRLEGKADDGK